MVKNKHRVRQTYGSFFHPDQFLKKKQYRNPNIKPNKYRKETLTASLMDKREQKGYIQCKIIFRKDKQPIIKFYQTVNGLPTYTFDINNAQLNKTKPRPQVLDPDTSFTVRHFIVEVPYNEFRKSQNKLRTLLDYHPGRMIFEQLANQLINK